MAGARRILSIDTFPSESTKRADVVLAAAAYGEKSGTTTNIEGRVSPVAQMVTALGTTRPDWMIACELGGMLDDRSFPSDHPLSTVSTVDDVTDAIAANVPGFAAATVAGLAGAADGVVVEPPAFELPDNVTEAAGRNSYDHRLVVSRKLYDRAVGTAMSRSLAHLAPGAAAHVHPLDLERIGVTDGDEVKLVAGRGAAVLPIRANGSVARGIVWAPFNQGGRAIEELIDAEATAIDVRIERIQ
jgi:predicted molibdopterin-dependent oxidoreductase YjgC